MYCCHNRWHVTAAITENNFLSSSFQPSLLSAEPLLPPHNFHSHSLRRLPLYQPLHISQPMPVSLSVGQPTLPSLPAHHRVLPAHTSISPSRVPPFLSLPRQQSSYRVDQVCLQKKESSSPNVDSRLELLVINKSCNTWKWEFIFVDHGFNGPYTQHRSLNSSCVYFTVHYSWPFSKPYYRSLHWFTTMYSRQPSVLFHFNMNLWI